MEDNSDSRYTVTASRRNEEALYWTTDDGLTYFTGFLDEIVTQGIRGAPAHLTMSRIFVEMHERFETLAATTIDHSVPLPTQLATTMAGEFPFAIGADVRKEQVAEDHMGDTLGGRLRNRLPHPRFVDLVRTGKRYRYHTHRHAGGLELRAQNLLPHAVDRDAAEGLGERGQRADHLEFAAAQDLI